MRVDFRMGLYLGVVVTLTIGLYCFWLWQPRRQIDRHTENLFHKIEQRNWTRVADLIAVDYNDQWNEDRALILERLRLVAGGARHLRFNVLDHISQIDNNIGLWRGRIAVDGDDSELIAAIKQRVNALTTPFELQWRHVSRKPWDWKLIRVSNPELEIPAGFD